MAESPQDGIGFPRATQAFPGWQQGPQGGTGSPEGWHSPAEPPHRLCPARSGPRVLGTSPGCPHSPHFLQHPFGAQCQGCSQCLPRAATHAAAPCEARRVPGPWHGTPPGALPLPPCPARHGHGHRHGHVPAYAARPGRASLFPPEMPAPEPAGTRASPGIQECAASPAPVVWRRAPCPPPASRRTWVAVGSPSAGAAARQTDITTRHPQLRSLLPARSAPGSAGYRKALSLRACCQQRSATAHGTHVQQHPQLAKGTPLQVPGHRSLLAPSERDCTPKPNPIPGLGTCR